jgi:tRNA pseudouridine38-40 synthase
MRNIKLLLEYDGTDFVGWQIQDNGRSVQGELEHALGEVTQAEVRVIGAGRTDAGVHARGQVAHFHTASDLSAEQLKRGANALIGEDVRVLDAQEVPLEFHARYSARRRSYLYVIVRQSHPLLRRTSWLVGYPMEKGLLDRCSRELLGQKDFRSFCKNGESNDNTVCTVLNAAWAEEGEILRFEISADRFVHGMVRALVGTMVDVARGYLDFEEFLEIIVAKDRTRAGTNAPPQGLVLETVLY